MNNSKLLHGRIQWVLILILSLFMYACQNSGTGSGGGEEELDPQISGISPEQGAVGTQVIISGTDFSTDKDDISVEFNGTISEVVSVTLSSIETRVPENATTGPISITVRNVTVTGPSFEVLPDAPGISSVEPDSGKVGDQVVISGENFGTSSSSVTVEFDNIPATVGSISDTSIETSVPEGVSGGSIDITVTVNSITATYAGFDIIVEQAALIPQTIDAGGYHTCALDEESDAYCWGNNTEGQLGTGVTSGKRDEPQAVRMLFGTKFQQISVGRNHTAAIDLTGNIWVWGANFDGQLGDGTTQYSPFMKQVVFPEALTFTKVEAGRRHTVALDQNGEVWTWGHNGSGQLGDSTTTDRLTPVKVQMPEGVTFTDVYAGGGRTMALTASGEYWGWGFNGNGRLGDGTTEDKLIPVKGILPDGVTLTELSAGNTYTLALDNSGKLWAWGFNSDGQLGNGTTDHSSELVPVDLPSNITVESASAGRRHNLAIATDGSVWAWGNNNFGAIGNGSFDADETAPVMVQVPSGEQFQMISAGLDYSMAISENDEIWGWGFNNDGQIGDSTRTDRYLPVKINFTAE